LRGLRQNKRPARFSAFKSLKHGFVDIQHNEQRRFRMAALATAVFLGLLSLTLCLSLLKAVFGLNVFSAIPGIFFARSYGILAFIIPFVLSYAAFILIDPRWRPGRIFTLSAAIFPFLTLAIGFSFIRDFDERSAQFAFLDFAGKTGFSFAIVVITLLEVLSLRMIRNALFPPPPPNGETERRASRPPPPRRPGETGVFLLPPPAVQPRQPSAETAAGKRNDSAHPPATGGANAPVPLPPALRRLSGPPAVQDIRRESSRDIEAEIEYLPLAEDRENQDPRRPPFKHDAAGIERAIEEAEVLAAIHSEQARKRAAAAQYARPYTRKYQIPVEILNRYPDGEYWLIDQATRDAAVTLRETLEEFKIQAEVTGIRKGPVITMFEILPAPGVKLSRIVNLQDNIALRLAASSVRIVAPIPGKHAVGIEVPNARRNIVSFREIIEGELQREGKRPEIPVVMGKDITGEAQTVDLVSMPHLLIAGATGAGKSVCVNAMILSILYQLPPGDCRLILIDPKIVELKLYNDIPHLLTPVITEPKRAFQALQYCIYEMERRYACLDSMGVRDIRNYNRRIKEKNIAQEHMPYIVVVIDEFADLMATTGKELESTVARLAAMSRAVGIHLVLATQRPSIDVITGLIKANIPSRIAFMVASKMDSRIIIDMVGAEKLLGKGDMLYAGVVDPFPIRMQGAFVSEEEVEAVVAHVKTFGEPDYLDDEIFYDEDDDETGPSLFSDGEDPLYDKALEIVLQQGKASASYIQRRLKIGYNRAARIVEEMAAQGVVGPAQGSKPRELLRGV
jgi:S-DNA-T family DNA segregation ATPase FtsK/SpoIIIE